MSDNLYVDYLCVCFCYIFFPRGLVIGLPDEFLLNTINII